ncbi:MAG: hypothetical protein ABI113_05605 [Mucilaginibacter sp.]
MEIQHTEKHNYIVDNLQLDKLKNHQPFMKQLIFWIMIILALICVVSLGMIIINYSVQANV